MAHQCVDLFACEMHNIALIIRLLYFPAEWSKVQMKVSQKMVKPTHSSNNHGWCF